MGAARDAANSLQAQRAGDGRVQAMAERGASGDQAADGDLPGSDGRSRFVWWEIQDHQRARQDDGGYGDRADGDGDSASVIHFASAGSRSPGKGAEGIYGRS